MNNADEIRKEALAALERDPRVNLHRAHVDVTVEEDQTILEGDVSDIEEKRVAVRCVAAIDGVGRVIDRLRVHASERLGDGAIRDKICRHLIDEPVYKRMDISCRIEGDPEGVERALDAPEGRIEAIVATGVITLSGEVWSLSHRRLAEVLAWWTPGCRNVVNRLEVKPAERDNDDEISDAIELVFDKDPLVHTDQIHRQVRDGRVVLRGLVTTEEEKRTAERNVWYVDGVHDVVNELRVYQTPAGREPARAEPPEFQ